MCKSRSEQCLKNCRTNKGPKYQNTRLDAKDPRHIKSRILVCEMLITPGPESIPAKFFDIEMLLGPGGRERTELEFADLFVSAGLILNRVIATSTPLRLLEAVIA
jgi:hypothetical protein